ncbi:uncharacterized protein ColSpa_09655 [Colletotrichum spaethianum]|uniref:Uncharacterized protein n=1 Tax=Colletotrichum spaethianum TaxID=700344 RepID=A0AA37PC50_9PEZI|nr:uncharacterized protein ColSpa_09655 [Colletotrichum spaethianum]GKT49474.1 hypothetical protein ColSpa_09655 [Colletotrichum spaethianum]
MDPHGLSHAIARPMGLMRAMDLQPVWEAAKGHVLHPRPPCGAGPLPPLPAFATRPCWAGKKTAKLVTHAAFLSFPDEFGKVD